MTALPAAAYISNATRKSGEVKVALEQLRDFASEQPGGGAETTLTIAAGVITPPVQAARFFLVAGEGSAADDLTNIDLTNIPDGGLIYLRCADAADVITVKSSAGGDGQVSTIDARDVVLDHLKKVLCLKRNGLVAEVVGMFNFPSGQPRDRRVVVKTGDYTVVPQDSGTLFTNAGAGADVTFTLPAAEAGLEFEFSTAVAFKLKVLAVGDDHIGDQGGTDTATPGYLQSSAAKGNTLRIVAVSSTRWAVMAKGGTWTVDS